MKVYLAMSSARPLTLQSTDLDERITAVTLPAQAGPWRPTTWTSVDRRTHLMAWSNEPEALTPLDIGSDAAVGCPGYLGATSDRRRFLVSDPGALADELTGVFSVFRADQRGFQALTTAVRLQSVFYNPAGEVVVASNRALLVVAALAALDGRSPGARIRYDLLALQSLIRSGYFLSDRTPFEGVEALPAHATLEATAGERRIAIRPLETAQRLGRPSRSVRSAMVDTLIETMFEAVSPLRAMGSTIGLSMTGGRDSRLVAAVLHAARIPFRGMTTGLPDHPDVVLARRVADILGIEHQNVVPRRDATGDSLVVSHPLRRAWEVIRDAEGMISAHNSVARPKPFRDAATTSGAGGEQLRGGFLDRAPGPEAGLHGRVRRHFDALEDYFTEAANEEARAALAPWMDRDPVESLDLLYLYYRSGRWSAAARAAATVKQNAFNLLLDNRINRRALTMPADWRATEEPFHGAISRLAPALADLPLLKARWRHDSREPRWPFRRRWRARAPVPLDATGAGYHWRNQPAAVVIRAFRDQVLGGPTQLFDLVHRPRIEALLERDALTRPQATLSWNVFTASVLLSDYWLELKPTNALLEIPSHGT